MSADLQAGKVSGTVQFKMDSLALFRGEWACLLVHRDRWAYNMPVSSEPRQSECIEVICDGEGNITVSVPACATVKVWGESA